MFFFKMMLVFIISINFNPRGKNKEYKKEQPTASNTFWLTTNFLNCMVRKGKIVTVHEFGIIDHIENEETEINYEPLKYNCISVDDEIINQLNERFSIMKTYFHSLKRPEFGLAYWGITVIPPESLSLFYEVITSSTLYKKSDELKKLAIKINKAKEESKYMIHYGI